MHLNIYKAALYICARNDKGTQIERGVKPLFLLITTRMISTEQLQQLIELKAQNTDVFLVQLKVRPGNKLVVTLDSDSGMTVDKLTEWNRYLENALDRDAEDFDLTVESPGVGEPLHVTRQYLRNKGRKVEVKTMDGQKLSGTIVAADDHGFAIGYRERETMPGKKQKQWVEKIRQLKYSDIKETRVMVVFN